jgi:ABC-2 type transport system permease protein
MFQRIYALIIKEFLSMMLDPKSRMTIIIPPMVQLVVFGYAATFDLNHISYAVYNEDRGALSRKLLSRFQGSPAFSLAGNILSHEEIAPLLDSRKVLMVLHAGPLCSDNMLTGRSCNLQVIIDGRNSNTALLALNYARDIISSFSMDLIERKGAQPPPARLDIRAWFNPNLESQWFIVPGIVAMLALVVTLVVVCLSVAKEHEAGTFDQLLVTPMTPVDILLGKTIPGFIVGMFEGSIVMLLAVVWFRVPMVGSLTVLYAGLAIYCLAAVGVGLMISSISTTQQQALLGGFIFLVPAVTLSGFATPIDNMPQFMQYVTHLDPMRYFLIIVRRVFLEGAGFKLLWPQFWPMMIIALCSLTGAAWFFRHKMY